MIYHFFNLLHQAGIKVPTVFLNYSSRMMLAAVTALILSIFLGPAFIRKLYEMKIGQKIRTDECPVLANLHKKKANTPTMGGILILFSMIVAMFLWMDLTHVFTLILFLTTLVLGLLGGYDDYLKLKYQNAKGLSGKKKMMIQILFSALLGFYLLVPAIHDSDWLSKKFQQPVIKEQQVVKSTGNVRPATKTIGIQEYASRLYLPFFKDPVLTVSGLFLLLAGLWIIIVVTGASNAVNLTDGLDGLAAGCLMMVATCLAVIGFLSNNIQIASYLNILYIDGSGEIAIYLSAFVGACLGFLWYNGHPAQVFMGDTGSLALGGIIGVSSILLRREVLLAVIGGVFVAEALSVILQVGSYRLRNKKRILLCAPLHHHFEYKGWPETKVVVRFWIIALLLAILGMATLKFQ